MPTGLHQLYLQIIDQQTAYLDKLQATFNKRCEEMTAQAEEQLKGIPESDIDHRKKILVQLQQQLNQALADLKNKISLSNGETRKKLETIDAERESAVLDELEEELKKN